MGIYQIIFLLEKKKCMKIKFASVKSFSKEDSLDIFINKFNIFIDYRVISVQWR